MQANKNRRLFSFERVMLYQSGKKGNDAGGKRGFGDHNAVSKQPKMKMMLTVKAYLEVMMLHQIGRK